jgi:type IV secretory pathway TraG/TraD family ATPase VirD4
MKIIIETLFELIITVLKGIFDLICFILQINPNDRLYEHSQMKSSDKRKLFSRFNKGLVVNGKKRITIKQALTHTLVVGKSGIGKTSSFFLPNLLKARNQSFVVTDLDGAMFKASSGHLKKQGYDIQVLNFEAVQKSAFFNPISFCTTNDELKALAEQIVFSSSASKGSSDEFWNFSSNNLLYLLLRLVKTQDITFQNLANVRHLLSQMETQGFKDFVSENTEGVLFSDYVSFHSKDVKLRTNIQASLSTTIDMFIYSDLAHITSKNTINLEKLTQPKAALFIIVPERLLKRNALILSVFYGILFDFVQKKRPKKPLYFLLDEVGNYYLKDLDILISILRRYNCSLSLGIQDISQIKKLFGRDASTTILSNTSTKIVFPGASYELADEISKIAGQKTVDILFEGETRQQIKPVLTSTEIIQMKKNRALFLVSNYPPVILKMHPYFKQFCLQKRSKLKPVEFEANTFVTPVLIPLTQSNQHEETT